MASSNQERAVCSHAGQAFLGTRDAKTFEPRLDREAMERAAAGTVGLALMADVPNNRWSQPTKLWEYLGMGVPLVASRLPGTELAMEGHEAVRLVTPGRTRGCR